MNSSPFELILSLSSVRTWIRGGNGNDVGSNSARERCPKFLVLSENVKGEAKKTFLLPDPRSCPAPKALLLGLFFFFSVVVTELHVRHNYYTFFDRNHPFLSAVLPPSSSSTLISLSTLSNPDYLKLYHRVIAGIRHLHTACRKSNLQTLSRPSPPLIPSISSFPSTLPALPLAHLHTLSNYYLAPPFTTLTDHDI